MRRQQMQPREDWQKRVEAKGLEIHTLQGRPYWNESACYLFTSAEIATLEAATTELYRLCVEAAGAVIKRGLWAEFGIPAEYAKWVEASWEADEPSVYGRFDLAWNGQGPPKMLEFNADTPTSLVEAAVIQWFWLEDMIKEGRVPAELDQWNSLHDMLIASWQEIAATQRITRLHLTTMMDQPEDLMTATYMYDVARQAGLEASLIDIATIGFNSARKCFVDQINDPIDMLFKLYPWEWLVREEFGREMPRAGTVWVEPPWKMIMANKAILPLLWEMFPDHPNLLWAGWEKPPAGVAETFVSKPIYGREGANVVIENARNGGVIAAQPGPYETGPLSKRVYQAYAPLPEFNTVRPVLGAWVIGGEAAGLGVREDDGPITTNFSRFVPHAIEG